MTNYGAFAFAWDGENRLTGVSSNGVPTASYQYDYMSRRYLKVTGSATNGFLYDGWNLISESKVQGLTSNVSYYVWGLDLSGSLQGAGGIGGLLAAHFGGTTSVSSVFYAFDANGNYYGYRYYMPESGRWASRDPIGEKGSLNVYAFCVDSPISIWDAIGLFPKTKCQKGASDAEAGNSSDPYVKQYVGVLMSNKCAFTINCYECKECLQQGMNTPGDATDPGVGYGPGKGSCRIRICASAIFDYQFTVLLRHELAHCVSYCGGAHQHDCEGSLCLELYAYSSDHHCDIYGGNPTLYRKCLRDSARGSARKTGCVGKTDAEMDAIMTDAFITKCLTTGGKP
jgi:hypothetical protein